MNRYITWSRVPDFILGLCLIFATERYWPAAELYSVILGLGFLLLTMALAKTIWLSRNAKKSQLRGEAKSWTILLSWQVVLVISVGVYFVYQKYLGDQAAPNDLIGKILLASWLSTFLLGGVSGVGLEIANLINGRGHHVDPKRLMRAGQNWALVGMALCIVVALNYAGSQKDSVYDWTYLKSTSPGEATQKIAQNLESDLTIYIFYPHENEVFPFIREYFSSLGASQSSISLEYVDKDLDPELAEKYRVSRNGQILLSLGDRSERIDVGITLKSARKKLKKLDQEFQKALLKLTRKKRVAYFTKGHGEFSWYSDTKNSLKSIRLLEKYFRNQNYTLKSFGISEGAVNKVPADASLVVVIGASRAFMPQEVNVLKEYVTTGGKLMFFMDFLQTENGLNRSIDNSDPLRGWLAEIGLAHKQEMLANEKNYVSATRSKADKWFLFSNTFTSHASVASLAKHEERVPMLIFQSGYFEAENEKEKWRHIETVRTLKDTFNDVNRNFKFDAGSEVKKLFTLGVASIFQGGESGKKNDVESGRIVSFADATAFSDAVIGAGPPGNLLYVADSLKWLLGEEELVGATVSEEDVRIQHSQQEDTAYFYSSVFGVPLVLLLMGFVATRRRRETK